MESIIQGRVFKFGDNINSDVIIPGRYLIYIDKERLGQHAFEMLGEGFGAKLRSFDILVAGRNFGCGSAREQAATAIQGLGIKAVVARSFERIHRNNLVGMGVLPLQFKSGTTWSSLGLTGNETVDIEWPAPITPQSEATLVIHRADGKSQRVPLTLRIDTPIEVDYFQHGGILPFVLRDLLGTAKASARAA